MRVLIDTNILLRLSQPDHEHHRATVASLRDLANAASIMYIGSQTVYEFLAVATRPIAESGLGLAHAQADHEVGKLVNGLTILCDSPADNLGQQQAED